MRFFTDDYHIEREAACKNRKPRILFATYHCEPHFPSVLSVTSSAAAVTAMAQELSKPVNLRDDASRLRTTSTGQDSNWNTVDQDEEEQLQAVE